MGFHQAIATPGNLTSTGVVVYLGHIYHNKKSPTPKGCEALYTYPVLMVLRYACINHPLQTPPRNWGNPNLRGCLQMRTLVLYLMLRFL